MPMRFVDTANLKILPVMSKNRNLESCRICKIIKIFLVSILFLLIIAITLSEDLHYLSFITPWNVAIFIIFFGFSSFLVKLIVYLNQKKKIIYL